MQIGDKIKTTYGNVETVMSVEETEIYFEDLPAPTQEAIIDLIVSIIKNKSQRGNKEM
jgi:hypothetical protein